MRRVQVLALHPLQQGMDLSSGYHQSTRSACLETLSTTSWTCCIKRDKFQGVKSDCPCPMADATLFTSPSEATSYKDSMIKDECVRHRCNSRQEVHAEDSLDNLLCAPSLTRRPAECGVAQLNTHTACSFLVPCRSRFISPSPILHWMSKYC